MCRDQNQYSQHEAHRNTLYKPNRTEPNTRRGSEAAHNKQPTDSDDDEKQLNGIKQTSKWKEWIVTFIRTEPEIAVRE